jgi:hypothetical protein
MVTYGEYLKNILSQTMDSYQILKNLQDKPGELDLIKKELLKINGFLRVITNKIEDQKIPRSEFPTLKSKFKHFLETYYFEQEIETMSPLYHSDTFRVKNMRLKILESLEDKNMMDDVKDLIDKL